MQPAAIQKADHLAQHLRGSQDLGHAEVLVSEREAWELLNWYERESEIGRNECFQADLKQARAFKTPWELLANFTIHGFPITRIDEETH
jgi:hypothetical protein